MRKWIFAIAWVLWSQPHNPPNITNARTPIQELKSKEACVKVAANTGKNNGYVHAGKSISFHLGRRGTYPGINLGGTPSLREALLKLPGAAAYLEKHAWPQRVLAVGNSYHTSLTRKSPEEMVDEVLTNIFNASKTNVKEGTR
jgi:hypothetical protein